MHNEMFLATVGLLCLRNITGPRSMAFTAPVLRTSETLLFSQGFLWCPELRQEAESLPRVKVHLSDGRIIPK